MPVGGPHMSGHGRAAGVRAARPPGAGPAGGRTATSLAVGARYRTRVLKGTQGEGATPGRQERSRHNGRHLSGSAERRAASADRSRSIHGTCRDGARRSRAR